MYILYIHAYMCKYIYFQEKTLGHCILYIIRIIYYFFTRVRSGICFYLLENCPFSYGKRLCGLDK